MSTRELVIEEARTWLRTPWFDNAEVKGQGVDCARFPIAVYSSMGIIDHITPVYKRQWALHQTRELYIEWILQCGGIEIMKDQVQPADFGVWHFGRTFSHGAIFTSSDTVIHALIQQGVIEETIVGNEELKTREARFFTLWRE